MWQFRGIRHGQEPPKRRMLRLGIDSGNGVENGPFFALERADLAHWKGRTQSAPPGTTQFTEYRQPEQYHTDRWIVNAVTFYLTFC